MRYCPRLYARPHHAVLRGHGDIAAGIPAPLGLNADAEGSGEFRGYLRGNLCTVSSEHALIAPRSRWHFLMGMDQNLGHYLSTR